MKKIGEVAAQLGISTDTLRYYEKNGLLQSTQRSDAGYRLYDDNAIATMRFVKRAKQAGFTLNEIKSLLAIKVDKSNHSCHQVKTFTEKKMHDVTAKIAELKRFEASLALLHKSCCGGDESAQHCSILSALEDVDGLSI